MGLLNIIRPMHFRQKLSIREIPRLIGVSPHATPHGEGAFGGEQNRAEIRHAGVVQQD